MPLTTSSEDGYKLSNVLVPRVIGDMKAVAKRITPEGKEWPPQIREALRFFRDLQDDLDQQFPANIK